jgi:oligoendopeptidase F
VKKFKNYLETIQEEKHLVNEGLEKNAASILIALSMLASPLQSKDNNDNYNKLQERINQIISNYSSKQETLKTEITNILNSLSDDQYKEYLDNITKNKQIKIGEQTYELNISKSDRQLVDTILGERKTYEPDKKVASKYILNKLGKKIEN